MVNGNRVSPELREFERKVNVCNPEAIDDAVSLAQYTEISNSTDFRILINKYRDECTCARIPGISNRRIIGASQRITPLVEQTGERVRPIIEQTRERISPYVGQASESARSFMERLRKTASPLIDQARERYSRTI